MKVLKLLPILFPAALALAISSLSAAVPGTYFEDNFANRDNWFTSEASSTLTAADGKMTQTLSSHSTFFGYLTESGLISLDRGQSIILRFDISYQSPTGNAPNIRFGLFDHSGVAGGRITEDGLGQSGAHFNGSRGLAAWNNGQNAGDLQTIRRRTTAANNSFLNSATPWGQTELESGGNSVPHAEAVVSDRIYTGEFRVTRLMDDNVTMASSLWYVNGEDTIVLYDAVTVAGSGGGRITGFDMVAFRVTDGADSVSLHSIKVEVIEDAWVSEYTAIDAPFDLDFGTGEGKEDGGLLLRSRVQDFFAQADTLRFSPTSGAFVSTGALAVVGNYQDGQNFTLQTALTVQGLSETGANRVGLAVLGGPHMDDGIPFNINANEGLYGLFWYPAEAEGASSLRIRQGFNGPLLAQEPWLGKGLEVQGTTVLFEDDFEDLTGSAANWTRSEDGLWEFGMPFAGPQGAVSGTQVAATSLNSQYPANTDSWLRTPTIHLTGLEKATLQFWEYTDVDTEGVEFHSTTVSILDAGTLQPVEGGELSKNADKTSSWRFRQLDLPPSAMGKSIVVEFRLKSDAVSGSTHDGWYVDDVAVTTPFAPDPTVFQLRAAGVYGQDGELQLSLTLTDEDDFSQTVSTVIADPIRGNLFGIGARSRAVEAGTPIYDFFNLVMEVGDGPAVGAGFAGWQDGFFNEQQLADESISGPAAAPAGDGIPNYLKYALGLEPFVPTVLSGVIESGMIEGVPTLTYVERVGAGDLEYLPEVSTDLVVWYSEPEQVDEISRETLPGGQFERVTVRAVLGEASAKAFLRVKVLSK